MTVLAIILFVVCYVVAILGVFLPMLPGVPIAAVGALLAAWLTGFQELTLVPLLVVAALVVLALVLDYVAGFVGAKRYGASRSGIWGSIIGALLGLFFFPPFGFLIGALGGAILAELLSGRQAQEALRAGVGVFVGTLGGMVANLFILIALGLVVFPRLF